MSKPKPEQKCRYCGQVILRTRHRVAGIFPRFMWKSQFGYYCVAAGGECRREPEESK